MYFKKSPNDGEIGNRTHGNWMAFSGEIRGDLGYVIGWQLGKLADALDKLPEAEPTSPCSIP